MIEQTGEKEIEMKEIIFRYEYDGWTAHADPPKGWFFNERWGKKGVCPRDGTSLKRAEVGGRTTAWCPKCQR